MDWKNRRKWYKVVSALACIVVFCTVYALILPAVTLERTAQCGREEHTHTETCYTDGALTCEKEEHVHTEACYVTESENKTDDETAQAESILPETEQTAESEETIIDDRSEFSDTETEAMSDQLNQEDGQSDLMTGTEDVQTADEALPAVLDAEGTEIHTADTEKDVNFGPYITSATVQKLENNTWKDSTTFTDGDQVKVSISYDLPAGAVNSESDTIYYQLPSGVRPIQNEQGQVFHDGKYVGDYVIDKDGLITIKFNSNFANGEAFSGHIEFKGTVEKSEAGEDGKIKFDGNGGEITVEDQKTEYDIQMKKSGQLGQDGKTISYTLTASTKKGTEGTVTIKDKFNNSSADAKYNNDAKIYKVDANGHRSEVTGYTPQYTDNSFTIENLPKLEAGEQYIVEYTAEAEATNADGSGSLSNSASAESNGKKQEVWNNVDVAKAMVSKEGGYDEINNTINWTVTINQAGKDLNGYQISDELVSDKNTVQAPSTVKMKNTRTGEETEIQLPYTFDTSTSDTYMITYQTPAGQENDTVKNKVSVKDKDGKTYTSEKTVGVTIRDWKISKSWAKEGVDADDQKVYYWNMEVTIPEKNLESFTYTDTIKDAVCNGETKTGSHYVIAADLQQAIEANLKLVTDQETLGYKNDQVDFVITYYDASGNTVPADDTVTHVVRFEIQVKPKDGKNIIGKKLQLNGYPTVVDVSDAKEGEQWSFGNTANIPEKTAEATHTFDKTKKLIKQSGLKVDDNNISYSEGKTTIDYEKTGGILYYRLIVNTDKGQNDAITLQDVLPKGVSLVPDSVQVKFYDNDYYQPDSKWINGQEYKLTDNKKPAVTTTPLSDGTTELKVVIPEGYNDANSENAFVVYYQIRIDQDTYWSDMSHEEQQYVNRVTWNGNEADQTTVVNREVTKLDKTVQQIKDSAGNYTNVVEYQVVINPAAQNLNPASSTLTLKDTLTLSDGVEASLDLQHTTLYQYSYAADQNRGEAIDSARYQVSYDENTHEMTVIVPDELACVFVYRYTINNGSVVKPTISNKVSLMGTEWFSEKQHILQEISSSAEVQKGKLTIYKVDSENYKKTLPGAEFLLETYDKDQGQWVTVNTDQAHVNGIYTTDSNGEIVFQGSKENQVLLSNQLYRLTEKKAPEGYALSEKPYYFVLMKSKNQYDDSVNKNQSQEDLAYQDMKPVFDQTKVDRKDVAFRANDTQVSMYIPNDYTNIRVRKVWTDANGAAIDNPPESVDVQLYRQIQQPKGCQVTLNIYQLNNPSNVYWTKTIQVKENTSLTIIWPDDWNEAQLTNDFKIPDGCAISIQGNVSRGKPVITTGAITADCTLNIGCSFYGSSGAEPTLEYEREYEVIKEAVPNGKVTLSSQNQWQYTWENLPRENTDGKAYYYTAEEVNVPSGYSVTISNNEGIQRGDIVITNKKDQSSQDYELPKTGGPGTTGYTFGGLLLMAAAGIFMYQQKSRRKGDKHLTF